MPSKGTTALCAFRIPEFVGSNRSDFTLLGCVENGRQRRSFQLLAASEEREEPMSESPTDRELLLEMLWRLGRIEGHLGILGYRSRIGDPNRPPVPRGEQGPVAPAVERSESKRVGPRTEPPPLLEPLLEQGGASEGET